MMYQRPKQPKMIDDDCADYLTSDDETYCVTDTDARGKVSDGDYVSRDDESTQVGVFGRSTESINRRQWRSLDGQKEHYKEQPYDE